MSGFSARRMPPGARWVIQPNGLRCRCGRRNASRTGESGRPGVHRVALAHRQELRAGRGGREQPDRAAIAVVLLVHVTPHHRPNVPMRVDHAPELIAVREADGVDPAAAHLDRMMVQAHHGMLRRTRQRAIEPLQFLRRQASADVAGIAAVEQYELPPVGRVGSAHLERRPAERLAHGDGLVVISRDAEHRLLRTAEDAAETQITGRIVLNQVARHQQRRVVGHACVGLVEHLAQACIRHHAAQRAGGAAVQVRIGYL